MDFDSFVKKYEGKETDIDGAAGVQCVDLSKAYLLDVFGIPMFSVTSAKNYYEKFSNYPELKGKFVRIPNTADFIPMKGDIAVWNSSKGGGHGHVAICTGEGTTSYFYSFDQNWIVKKCVKVYHDYKGFLGVLRATDRSPIIGSAAQNKYYPKYGGNSGSLADALVSVGVNASFYNRRIIAKANGIDPYIGTAKQNTELLMLLRQGRLIRPA